MARELPIQNGRLTTDLDADGHRIKNLPGGGIDTVSWDNVTDKPNFATVATSGNYNDLTDKPVINKPPNASDDSPQMNGTAFAGNSNEYSRGDHVHPTDTSRQAALSAQQLANIAAVPSKYEMPSGGIPATDLAQAVQTALSAIPGKASAADLRYRIADAGFKYQFAASAFPITYMNTITSTPVTITAGDAGDITWDVQPDGSAYVSYNGFDFAYFSSIGDYGGSSPGVDLQFNGVAAENAGKPLVQTVADRTVNLITARGETSIDIELPDEVWEPEGVRRARDFFVDVDNSRNGSDLALEFTGLGVDYGFVTDADDDIGEMMTIAGYGTGSSGDGERVRFYFTECAMDDGASGQVLFHVARVTLGADIDSIPTTQGGN